MLIPKNEFIYGEQWYAIDTRRRHNHLIGWVAMKCPRQL